MRIRGEKYKQYQKEYHKTYDKEYYNKNKTKILIQKKEYFERLKERVRKMKSEKGCIRCGENDWRCLDFHHLRDKEYNVGRLLATKRWRLLLKEVEKCIVFCSNCHRKETIKE